MYVGINTLKYNVRSVIFVFEGADESAIMSLKNQLFKTYFVTVCLFGLCMF